MRRLIYVFSYSAIIFIGHSLGYLSSYGNRQYIAKMNTLVQYVSEHVPEILPSYGASSNRPYHATVTMSHPRHRTRESCFILESNPRSPKYVVQSTSEALEDLGGQVRHTFFSSFMKGSLICYESDLLVPMNQMSGIPWIKRIERDIVMRASYTQFYPSNWGLDRIDQSSIYLNNKFRFQHTGFGVNIYVLDTGIYRSHEDFTGRVKNGFSVYSGGTFDGAGHGSHVAGILGGHIHGVAKRANIVPIKVLDSSGSGSNSGVLRGLEYIYKKHKKPAVVNMSLGGSKSAALENAIQVLERAGITVVVAAGNENQNACNFSPSGSPAAFTVGASTKFDTRASFSNYGKCVNIFAPGRDIKSTDNRKPSGSRIMDGTSMASPFVAGVAALLLEENPHLKPFDVKIKLLNLATRINKITLRGSPNYLLKTPKTN